MKSAVKRLGLVRGRLEAGTAAAALLLLVCGVLFGLAERGSNDEVDGVRAGLNWVLLTLLTQSSPTSVATPAGMALYWAVLVVGVGLVAMATGAIASKLLEVVLRKGSGMSSYTGSGHIVICGWSTKGVEILRELHAEEVADKRHVVILAALEANPSRDPRTTFVRGSAMDATDLERAGVSRADTAIVLADHSNAGASSDDMDARTLLTTLAVESVNPDCYTCVEVIRSENRVHFQRTHADELVVSAELTGALLASSAVTHGLSRVVTDLITHPEGTEFYAMPVPAEMVGRRFSDVLGDLKARYDCVAVAVRQADGEYLLNPGADVVLPAGGQLLVIASQLPTPSRQVPAAV